ncbi:hypothetical protein JB92DRAFT_2826560 [Gautieria morchelliformis]|nr:hypothetical protein JB92DRAFT_2826560 [Gautieria morchelliformis]
MQLYRPVPTSSAQVPSPKPSAPRPPNATLIPSVHLPSQLFQLLQILSNTVHGHQLPNRPVPIRPQMAHPPFPASVSLYDSDIPLSFRRFTSPVAQNPNPPVPSSILSTSPKPPKTTTTPPGGSPTKVSATLLMVAPQSPRPITSRHGSNVANIGPFPPVPWSSHGALGRLSAKLSPIRPTFMRPNEQDVDPLTSHSPQARNPGFQFIAPNALPPKPRLESGRFATQNRGPYYNAAFGPRVLAKTLALTEPWERAEVCRGIERVLATSNDRMRHVERYVRRCKDLAFDVIELSTGSCRCQLRTGLNLYNAYSGQYCGFRKCRDVQCGWADRRRKTLLDEGAEIFMIRSEGITENYIQNHGVDVNLFIDHSPAVQLACLGA